LDPPHVDVSQIREEKVYQTQRADTLVNKRVVDKSYIKMLEDDLAAARAQADSLNQFNASVLNKEIHALRQQFESAVDEEVQKRLEVSRGKQAEITELDMSAEDAADMEEVEQLSKFLHSRTEELEAESAKALVS